MPDEIVAVLEPAAVVAATEPAPPGESAVVSAPDRSEEISQAELVAQSRILDATLASAWSSREATMTEWAKSAYEADDKDKAANIMRQLEVEKAKWQVVAATLPQKLSQYNEGLTALHKETGIPVALLKTAQSADALKTLVAEWGKAHPKAESKPAGAGSDKPAPQAKVETVPTNPVGRVDSGATVGSTAGADVKWRNFSALDKISLAMGSSA